MNKDYGLIRLAPKVDLTLVDDKDPKVRATALHQLGTIMTKKAKRLECQQHGLSEEQGAVISCFLHAVHTSCRRAWEENRLNG